MRNDTPLCTALGIITNILDLIFAFFLELGGWNLANRISLPAGYACMGAGLLLSYLSSAVWTGHRLLLLVRATLYWIVFCCLAISGIVLFAAHNNDGLETMIVVDGCLLTAAAISSFHLRLAKSAQSSTCPY